MKYNITFLFLLLLSLNVYSQKQASGIILEAALKTASKMKDSLHLSNQQKNQIFEINMQLYEAKQSKRRELKDSLNLLSKAINDIEHQRDTKYKLILSNLQFDMYIKDKKYFLSN